MAADYLISSLQPLALDDPAPCTAEQFIGQCRSQLSEADVAALETIMEGSVPSGRTTRILARWLDLDAQIRNAIAAERARLRGQDAARWRRPVDGCSLYWANRVTAVFQEKDPSRRERLLDQLRWDAAGELTPPAAPLSTAAAYTYAIRLSIVIRRSAIDVAGGNDVFNRLTAESKIDFKEKRT